jgi:hypothetical protein
MVTSPIATSIFPMPAPARAARSSAAKPNRSRKPRRSDGYCHLITPHERLIRLRLHTHLHRNAATEAGEVGRHSKVHLIEPANAGRSEVKHLGFREGPVVHAKVVVGKEPVPDRRGRVVVHLAGVVDPGCVEAARPRRICPRNDREVCIGKDPATRARLIQRENVGRESTIESATSISADIRKQFDNPTARRRLARNVACKLAG